VIGTPLWPTYALRATGLVVAVPAPLVLLGGLIQVNPIWQYGPYEPWLGTNWRGAVRGGGVHDALRLALGGAQGRRGRRRHDLLDRPRDKPWRTALGAAFFSWVAIIFIAGAADRILVSVGFGYEGQVWFFRVAAFVVPFFVLLITGRVCDELTATNTRWLRSFAGTAVRRGSAGGFEDMTPFEPTGESEERARPTADQV
jgi:ubiquinol-cytochrome c reductase cytochrome b subunit